MMGTDIRRSAVRHYTGRLFATAGSLVLGVPVYDTQCGAKAFRVTDALRAALAEPFVSRWAFDVEVLGRLLRSTDGRGGGARTHRPTVRRAAPPAVARARRLEAHPGRGHARRPRPRAHPSGTAP